MRVLNTGTQPIIINLRDGRSFIAQPSGPAVDLLDSDVSLLDDSAFLIGLFNAGTLVAQTDAGAPFTGFPASVNNSDALDGRVVIPRARRQGGVWQLWTPDNQAIPVGSVDEATVRNIVIQELTAQESYGFAAASIPGLGSPINLFKTSGTDFDFALENTGNPTVGTWGTVPADACAIEFWSNGTASDDVIYWATRSGNLSSTGNLATNLANNDGATNPARRLSSGEHVVLPLTTTGTVDALFRFAGGKAGARMQGRFLSANSRFPYRLNSNTEAVIAGAGASAQLPFTDTSRFPAGTIGVTLQIKGAGGVRARYDGGVPSATFGDLLPNGNYFIDYARHGVAISALRLFVPANTWIIANALKAAT